MFNFTFVKYFIVELEEVNLMVFSYPNTTLHVETFIQFLVPPTISKQHKKNIGAIYENGFQMKTWKVPFY